MLAAPGLSSYGFTYDNWGASPGGGLGTSVTPGASDAEGSWTQLASAANVSRDVYMVEVTVLNGFTASSQKDHMLDLGVDNAGGTSYAAIISDILCGASSQNTSGGGGNATGGRSFLFPIFIKAGSTIAARIQGNNATAGTVRVGVKLWGDPSNPEVMPVGQFAETIGTITGSAGVSFTPGNAADGSWASLGTTAKDLWWWQLCPQLSNATMTANRLTYVDLAVGDATNKSVIMRHIYGQANTETLIDMSRGNLSPANCYRPVPAGSNMYVRGRGDGAADSGWNAVAIGIGG